jgi:hypothetical protein
MLKSARTILLIALASMIATPPVTAKTLRWKLDPKQKYRVVSTWSTRHLAGASEVINTTTCDMVWTINSIDADGNLEVVQTLSHVKQSLQSPSGTTFQYDSQDAGEAKGTAAKMATYWKPLLGSERVFKLTPQGKLLPDPEGAKVDVAENELLGRSFTRDDWRAALRRSNIILPADAVEAGQTWLESQTIPLPFSNNQLKITQTYTYAGEKQPEDGNQEITLDVIELATRFQIEKAEDGDKEVARLKIAQQNGSGEIVFDAESGRPVRSKYDQSVTLRLEKDNQAIETQMTTDYEMTFQLLPQVEATAGEPGQK